MFDKVSVRRKKIISWLTKKHKHCVVDLKTTQEYTSLTYRAGIAAWRAQGYDESMACICHMAISKTVFLGFVQTFRCLEFNTGKI